MRTLALLAATAFANTNSQSTIYICETPQNIDLLEADYEALTWVEIGAIGSRGEMGNTTNILSYDTWNTTVDQKAKGRTNAGDPELEVARIADDPGQIILRTAAAVGNNNKFAFKEERNDAPAGGTPTIIYNRGIVTGPRRPGGRNEDFDLELYTLGLVQEEVLVPAAEAVVP